MAHSILSCLKRNAASSVCVSAIYDGVDRRLHDSRQVEVRPGHSFRAMFRGWHAELAPFPNRWRRAARVALVTALGAGVMAALQIANPLGLTLMLSFAAPESAFSLGTAVSFLAVAGALQVVMLALVGAAANSPVVHVGAFIVVYLRDYLPDLRRAAIGATVVVGTNPDGNQFLPGAVRLSQFRVGERADVRRHGGRSGDTVVNQHGHLATTSRSSIERITTQHTRAIARIDSSC